MRLITLSALLPIHMQVVSLVVVITIILVVIFFIKDRNNSMTDGDTDVYVIDETVGDDVDVHIIQTSKKNDDPYSNTIEMQDLSPTSN